MVLLWGRTGIALSQGEMGLNYNKSCLYFSKLSNEFSRRCRRWTQRKGEKQISQMDNDILVHCWDKDFPQKTLMEKEK
jgi:hypothetical protein